jgi:hypothetical protein
MSRQTPNAVLMMRPAAFGYNIETAASNTFQYSPDKTDQEIHQSALLEFDRMVDDLRSKHLEVIVVEDTAIPVTPDAIFPNNWFTTHSDGAVILYPMEAANRRGERRRDVIDQLKHSHQASSLHDMSANELEGKYLEGTGSIVFDHIGKKAYACRSSRTDLQLLIDLCKKIQYEPVIFTATDSQGINIYHTNVMMCVGTELAIVCLESIAEEDQERVIDQLQMDGKQIIAIGYEQVNNFAGNMLEVENDRGERFLAMSKSAFQSLVNGQINAITKSVDIIELSIPTIEQYGGGGVRCMMAGIHLPKN